MPALALTDKDALPSVQLGQLHHPVHQLQADPGMWFGGFIAPDPVRQNPLLSDSISNPAAVLGEREDRLMG
jgi:hypothetical protein